MPTATSSPVNKRKIVSVNPETVTNISSTDFPLHHAGEDLSWNIEKFDRDLTVQFHKNDPLEATFSLVGVDASLANAFRRICLSEVASLAVEQVYMINNTSVIADEVLCHRLGLIPFKGSLAGLRGLRWFVKPDTEAGIAGTDPSDFNTVVLNLKVRCERDPNAAADATTPEEKYINSSVYARDIKWDPQGLQGERFSDGAIEPVNPDILIAKLRPGQEIDLVMHAVLGKGGDHAKFSPVATATYRLLPLIDVRKPILGADAKKFQRCFPRGVIELERVTAQDAASDNTAYHNLEGEEKAVVRDPMRDTVSRECLRHDEFKDKVKLGRVQDHFIFNIESTGQFESDEIFLEAVRVLKYKGQQLLQAVEEIER